MHTSRDPSRYRTLLAKPQNKRGALVGLCCAAVLALSGCGFQPRGRVQLPFSSLYVQVASSSQLGHEIKRTLRAGNTRLTDSPAAAQATLIIMSEIREKQILSLGGQGRVREYQLRYRVGYQLTDGKTVRFISPTEILLTRDVSFNDSELLAKEAEEALLYRDMQTDAVQQLVRRLQAAKIPS